VNDAQPILYIVKLLKTCYAMFARAALIPGIYIGIGPIPSFFGGIKIGYTSTNSVVCALLSKK